MKRLYRIVERLLALLGLLVVAVSVTPVTGWWATWLAGPWQDPGGDVLVVLGGSVLDNGRVGGSSYWRAVYGAEAFRQGRFQTLVICGGRDAGVSISAPMRDFLVSMGVPADRIVLEEKSGSTRENALGAAEILVAMPGRKVLLTSDFHMYRAIRTFRRAGIAIEPRPFPDVRKRAGAWQNRWSCFQDLCLETAKIVYYKLRGWV